MYDPRDYVPIDAKSDPHALLMIRLEKERQDRERRIREMSTREFMDEIKLIVMLFLQQQDEPPGVSSRDYETLPQRALDRYLNIRPWNPNRHPADFSFNMFKYRVDALHAMLYKLIEVREQR
jgi:hypothetical protein